MTRLALIAVAVLLLATGELAACSVAGVLLGLALVVTAVREPGQE